MPFISKKLGKQGTLLYIFYSIVILTYIKQAGLETSDVTAVIRVAAG
jgi:hypothetical protein